MANDKNKNAGLPDPAARLSLLSAETAVMIKDLIDQASVKFDNRFFKTKLSSTGREVTMRNVEEFLQAAGVMTSCPLGGLVADPSGGLMIRPGMVHGGGNDVFLQKGNIVPVADQHLYIEVSWTAAERNGVLRKGGVMSGAEIKQGGASDLIDDVLTVDNLTGFHRRSLGVWDESLVFNEAGCGSYNVGMCSDGVESTFQGVRDGGSA